MNDPLLDEEKNQLKEEFNILVSEVQEELLVYAERLSGSKIAGDELFMKAWWEVLERFPKIQTRDEVPFRIYFQKVIKRYFVREVKERSKNVKFGEEWKIGEELTQEKSPEEIYESNELLSIIKSIDPLLQKVIFLESEGLSHEESATELGVNTNEFIKLLTQARELLQGMLLGQASTEEVNKDKSEIMENAQHLTIEQIAIILNQPWTWVIRNLAPYKELSSFNIKFNGLSKPTFPTFVIDLLNIDQTNLQEIDDYLLITQIADILDVDWKWVCRRVFSLSLKPEFRINKMKNAVICFNPKVIEELKQFHPNTFQYADPEKHIHIHELSQIIGRSRLWITNRLDELNIEPMFMKEKMSRVVRFYTKEVIPILEEERDKFPDSNGRITIPIISEAVGKDREWVTSRLAELNIIGELRRFETSGRVDLSFEPEVVLKLKEIAAQYQPAEDGYYTEFAISNMVGKNFKWVKRRLIAMNASPKMMNDSKGVPRKHYSLETVEELKKLKKLAEEKKKGPKWYEQ